MKSPTALTSPSSRPTPTTTQMTTAASLTTTPGICENGGTWDQDQCVCVPGFSGDRCQVPDTRCRNGGSWDGVKCLCPSTFYGSLCESPVEQLEIDTVETEVGMEVSVDQEFSQDLKDNTSKAYRDFSNAFQGQMQKIYQTVQGFQGVRILSLSRLSLNCPAGYEDFRFPLVEPNRLRCVTSCTPAADVTTDRHRGQCFCRRTVQQATPIRARIPELTAAGARTQDVWGAGREAELPPRPQLLCLHSIHVLMFILHLAPVHTELTPVDT
ncbi:mucin-3B-like [Peromyscus californicus insignis]|uniref:mucin-3B-like n=1 Tax=Peromyscus californicus insignis TaxID=564181 RepID=UPI0022A6EAAE|nr:mucin-3B-like [Peromyscus californicus insignis]